MVIHLLHFGSRPPISEHVGFDQVDVGKGVAAAQNICLMTAGVNSFVIDWC